MTSTPYSQQKLSIPLLKLLKFHYSFLYHFPLRRWQMPSALFSCPGHSETPYSQPHFLHRYHIQRADIHPCLPLSPIPLFLHIHPQSTSSQIRYLLQITGDLTLAVLVKILRTLTHCLQKQNAPDKPINRLSYDTLTPADKIT